MAVEVNTARNAHEAAEIAQAVADSTGFVVELCEGWHGLPYEHRLPSLRAGIGHLTIIATADANAGRVALAAVAQSLRLDEQELQQEINERVTLLRHLPSLLQTHRHETEAAICAGLFT